MRVSRAVGALGEMLRRELSSDGSGSMSEFVTGQPTPRSDLEGALGTDVVELLIADGLFRADNDMVTLAVVILATRDTLTTAPDVGDRTDRVYMGLDSAYLIEAALRLAPAGERAADLGTGTGLLAAILSRRYQVVVATDVVARAAAAAQLTLALNRAGDEHVGGALVTDVAGGLRSGCFDLVAANAPWVPTPSSAAERSRPYRDGGPTGVELPTRFIEAGAALLRPGGVAVTLALDVILEDGRRPLREVCADLNAQGNETAVLPTPVNGRLPELRARICAQHETLVGAEHVAVVVVRPRAFTSREDTLVAAEALGRRSRKSPPSRQPREEDDLNRPAWCSRAGP